MTEQTEQTEKVLRNTVLLICRHFPRGLCPNLIILKYVTLLLWSTSIVVVYRHLGTIATNAWTCGQSQMPKLWHGARIPSGLVAKVKMAKMTKM